MKSRIVGVLVMLVIGASSASAQTVRPGTPSGPTAPQPTAVKVSAEDLAKAEVLLSDYHALPTKEALESALSEPRATMFFIAQDPTRLKMFQDRALAALVYWPDDQVRALYEGMLSAEGTAEMTRHRLITLLVRGWGDAAIPTIAPWLRHDDVQLRLTAVVALGDLGTPSALATLRTVEASEKHPLVIERIQKELGR